MLLPVFLGAWLGLCRASLCAPTAFIASVVLTQDLVGAMLGLPSPPSPLSFNFDSSLEALAQSSVYNEWRSLEGLGFTVSQQSLFRAIDDACFDDLLRSTQDSHFKALALSSFIPHSEDWLRVILSSQHSLHFQDSEYRFWVFVCPTWKLAARLSVSQGDVCGDHQVGCGGNNWQNYLS